MSYPSAKNPLFNPFAAMQQQISKAGIPAEVQELYAHGQEIYSQAMDRAIGLQKASLEAAVRLQSDVIESCKESQQNGYWLTPGLAGWMEAMASLLASVLEWQMKALPLLLPFSPLALQQFQHTAEEFERGMDMGTGQAKRIPPRRVPAAG